MFKKLKENIVRTIKRTQSISECTNSAEKWKPQKWKS